MFCETNHFHFHITDSISFYFNFGKDHYFVLRVKQRIFGKAQIFQMNRVNPAIINWREENVETCARRSPSFKNFLGKKKICKITSFPITPNCIKHSNNRTRNNLKNTNTMKYYSCASPFPSPFHYVVVKIVPTVHLAAHAKSSTLYRCPYGHKSKLFRLDGLLLFCITMGLRCVCCELRYEKNNFSSKVRANRERKTNDMQSINQVMCWIDWQIHTNLSL